MPMPHFESISMEDEKNTTWIRKSISIAVSTASNPLKEIPFLRKIRTLDMDILHRDSEELGRKKEGKYERILKKLN